MRRDQGAFTHIETDAGVDFAVIGLVRHTGGGSLDPEEQTLELTRWCFQDGIPSGELGLCVQRALPIVQSARLQKNWMLVHLRTYGG